MVETTARSPQLGVEVTGVGDLMSNPGSDLRKDSGPWDVCRAKSPS
jgi:hypothetical protein